VSPHICDPEGFLKPGKVLEWMDVVGVLAASRHCRRPVVTASVDGVELRDPIRVGEHVALRASVAYTSERSMGIHVAMSSTPLLDEVDALGLASNTIVILTADHGDLDGAHRLHGKGATAYREQNQVPLIVAHPAYAGGKRCRAVTTHLDLAPTLLNLSAAAPDARASLTKTLPGKDFSPLLSAPAKAAPAAPAAVRDGALYCYNMLAYLDGDFTQKAVEIIIQPDGKRKVQAAAKQGQLQPNLLKRGAIRGVFDGRYQFSRYFSPTQHNRPTSLDSLFSLNDVELFDLEKDPLELENLALDRRGHAALLEEMNAKLNRLIEAEVGEDVGQMLPARVDGGWVATDATKDV
jgi:arylsulfatase A-like enzyme